MDNNLKILILEDNTVDAELVERELRSNNIHFSSRRADTEAEFIKALNDFSPGLILADYTLPTYTGLEALQYLKENSIDIPLIIVTGSLSEETAVNCIKQGAADYIIKESLMRLPSAVESTLEKQKTINEKKLAEERIKRSLQEKETLLKEIFHRVKNNLQVISSLIKLQGQQFKDNEEIHGMFKKSQDRIQAMALIHEKLYQSQDMTRIDFVKYTRDLINHLFSSYGVLPDAVAVKISIKDVYMDINTAIPCGLIINELISNSLKHAFPEGRKGEISIAIFTYENRAFNLIVSDNGIGFSEKADFSNLKSLGLQLVTTLVQQMGGQITHEVKKGSTFRIVFTPPKRKYTENFISGK